MKKFLLCSVLLFVFIACGNPKKEKAIENEANNKLEIVENVKDEADLPSNSILIKENCALFLWPDSTEMVRIRGQKDDEAYKQMVAEMSKYPGIASKALDSLGIKTIDFNETFIIFRNAENRDVTYVREELPGNMVFFNVNKEPMVSFANLFDEKTALEYFDK